MYTENDNINWERVKTLSNLPADELDQMIAEEEEEIKRQMQAISQ